MNEPLRASLLKTLAWFDIFSYPLTSEDIYRFLWCDDLPEPLVDYCFFLDFLDKILSEGLIERKFSYYFLPGRNGIIEKRRRSDLAVEKKIGIARRAVQKIRWIPFVKAVFLCNTLAFGWPDDESDIDVFIVTRGKRIWMARLFTTLVLSLFKLRRTKNSITNKICLSFYASEDSLDLSDVLLDRHDIYFAYWLAHLIPIYDPNDISCKINEKNRWARWHIANGFRKRAFLDRRKVKDFSFQKAFKKALERVWGAAYGDLIESQAKFIQKKKMARGNPHCRRDTGVIISDSMLKFHENDRREEYRSLWEKRCEEILAAYRGRIPSHQYEY